MTALLLALQIAQVTILWVHDWVPLGALNDVAAVRRQDGPLRLAVVTLVQALPFTIGMGGCVMSLGAPYPAWLGTWLWISYGVLFLGELRAWWWPYLVHADAARVERYRAMFGHTATFLKPRNGIVPNMLHCVLHACTAATLVVLACKG